MCSFYFLWFAGLSDAGSFDTQMAHLFKGIADRASGQVREEDVDLSPMSQFFF
jgi:hypothetical protein